MKKLTFDKLHSSITRLYGKIETIEIILNHKNPYPKKVLSQNNLVKKKCSSNYNKSDLAHFFYILMDEKILFFDNYNKRNNRSEIQLFIQENFTYAGDSGLQTSIKTISKQFSESKGFCYKDKQIKFLDNIIDTLKKRKEKLICW